MATERVQQILATAVASAGRDVSLPDSLCNACAIDMPVSGVGLALMSERGHEGLVAATDGPAIAMEDIQFTLGEGPCLDASSAGRPVMQPDLRLTGPGRWPGFGPAALDAGIAAVFAFPLQVGRIRLGVLDLYRDTPGGLTTNQVTESLAYADAAVIVLLHLQARQSLEGELHPDLIAPSMNLAEVHQATGMVAVQAGVTLTEALLLLRAHSFGNERTILDVAYDVLRRRLRFNP